MANTSKKSLDINGLEYVASKVMTLVNSGGTADYLVEEGTSDIWTYRKWASGIAECWGTASYSGSWAAWGSLYALTFNSIYYPFTFYEVPIVQYTPNVKDTGSNSCWAGTYNGMSNADKKIICRPALLRPTSGDTSTYYCHILAKGLWKEFTPDIMKTPSLDLYYPVGSIYQTSNANFDPNVTFGGTWELITNKFLIGAGDEYENGEEGGSTEHTHKYGVMYHTYFYTVQMESGQGGVLTMENGSETTLGTETTVTTTDTVATNNANAASSKNVTAYAKSSIGYTGKESTIPPYKAVYMWERTA